MARTATVEPVVPDGPVECPIVRVVACGSVDDGKSTLIGRLLTETGSVPDDLLDYARRTRRSGSTIPAGQVDFSLLTDGLEAERAQGITIDVAYRHVYLPSGRRLIIADAPGHEQYTRNMAVAASTADIAVLLVDATRGVRPQTCRHLTVCALMGVRTVIVVVNKLDAVGYGHAVFEEMASGVRELAGRLDIDDVVPIPVSALAGDNVTIESDNTPWYPGPTLLDALTSWSPPAPASADMAPRLRLPVQCVIRADGFRGYAGTVAAGRVVAGKTIMVAGSGATATVDRVLAAGVDVAVGTMGQAVVVFLREEVDISRGDVLVAAGDGEEVQLATAFNAELVWTGQEPLRHGRSYLLVSGPRTVAAVVTAVRSRRALLTGERLAARKLDMNDIGTVEITTNEPVLLDRYMDCRDTGGFLLVERISGDTVAAGLVNHSLRRGYNVIPHDFTIDRAARAALKRQQPKVLWFTGLPGSGKSTLADALDRHLYALGLHSYVLDGDNMRTRLNKDLGFTPEDRAENVRRVAETAALMLDAGLIVLVALVSPFRADRNDARRIIGNDNFVEVYVDTPVEICAERDPKGLYAKARAGAIPNLTGVGQGYEPPEKPEIVINGTTDPDEVTRRLLRLVVGDA